MKRTLLTLTYLFFAVLAFGQVKQSGRVLEYKFSGTEKKTALKRVVQITVDGAASTVSDMNTGAFELNFNTKKKGDRIVFAPNPRAMGYELMNTRELESWNINPNKPLNVVFCNKSRFDELCAKYYNISLKSYETKLAQDKQKLADALKANKLQKAVYEQKLAELETSYQTNLANIDKYVDQFARIDLSEVGAKEQAILALVDEGKIDEAIAEYDKLGALKKLVETNKNISKLDSDIKTLESVRDEQKAAKDSLLAVFFREIDLLKVAGGKDNYDKIYGMFTDYVTSDSTNVQVLGSFIQFLCYDYNKAEICIRYCEMIKRHDLTPEILLDVDNALLLSYSILHKKYEKNVGGVENDSKIFAIHLQELKNKVKINEKGEFMDFDDNFNNCMSYLYDYTNFVLNSVKYDFSIDYYAPSEPLVRVLNYLHIFVINVNDTTIPIEWSKRFSKLYYPFLTYAGALDMMELKNDSAKTKLAEVINFSTKELQNDKSAQTIESLYNAYCFMGETYLNEENNDSAYCYFTEAEKLMEECSKTNMYKYAYNLGHAKTCKGKCKFANGDYEESLTEFVESDRIYVNLIKNTKDSIQCTLPMLEDINYVGMYCYMTGDYDKALQYLKSTWEFCEAGKDDFEGMEKIRRPSALYLAKTYVEKGDSLNAFKVLVYGGNWYDTDKYVNAHERKARMEYKAYQIDFGISFNDIYVIFNIDEYLLMDPGNESCMQKLNEQIEKYSTNTRVIQLWQERYNRSADSKQGASYKILKEKGLIQ